MAGAPEAYLEGIFVVFVMGKILHGYPPPRQKGRERLSATAATDGAMRLAAQPHGDAEAWNGKPWRCGRGLCSGPELSAAAKFRKVRPQPVMLSLLPCTALETL